MNALLRPHRSRSRFRCWAAGRLPSRLGFCLGILMASAWGPPLLGAAPQAAGFPDLAAACRPLEAFVMDNGIMVIGDGRTDVPQTRRSCTPLPQLQPEENIGSNEWRDRYKKSTRWFLAETFRKNFPGVSFARRWPSQTDSSRSVRYRDVRFGSSEPREQSRSEGASYKYEKSLGFFYSPYFPRS